MHEDLRDKDIEHADVCEDDEEQKPRMAFSYVFCHNVYSQGPTLYTCLPSVNCSRPRLGPKFQDLDVALRMI